MPKGPNGEIRPGDTASCAVTVAQIATGEIEDTKYKQPGKRKGGVAGGRARAEALTPEQRQEIAKKAALARWG